jgi:peptidoglycan/LPS O-acetylase OafA/YrhL
MQSPASRSRIPSLDGLRAVSIAIVLLAHVSETEHFQFPPYTHKLYSFGVFGVRIFFVISGFLITTLLLDEETRKGHIGLGGFYLRRAFRIWPVAYAFILAVAVLAWRGYISLPPYNLLFAATFTMNHVSSGVWWTGHLWSLSVEEQFYLVWPLVFLACGIKGRVLSCWLVIVVAPLLRVTTFMYARPVFSVMQSSLLFLGDAIAIGCLLALMRPYLERQPVVRALVASPWFFLAPVLSVLFYASVAAHLWGSFFALGDSLSLVLIGATVWRVVHWSDFASRFLNTPLLVAIGQRSYSLYIWQQLFLDKYSTLWINRFPQNLIGAIATAIVSYHLIELPFLELRTRVLKALPERWRTKRLPEQSKSGAAVASGINCS